MTQRVTIKSKDIKKSVNNCQKPFHQNYGRPFRAENVCNRKIVSIRKKSKKKKTSRVIARNHSTKTSKCEIAMDVYHEQEGRKQRRRWKKPSMSERVFGQKSKNIPEESIKWAWNCKINFATDYERTTIVKLETILAASNQWRWPGETRWIL